MLGAYLSRDGTRVCSKIVSPMATNSVAPKYWKKKISAVAMEISFAGRKDCTAVIGWEGSVRIGYSAIRREKRIEVEGLRDGPFALPMHDRFQLGVGSQPIFQLLYVEGRS